MPRAQLQPDDFSYNAVLGCLHEQGSLAPACSFRSDTGGVSGEAHGLGFRVSGFRISVFSLRVSIFWGVGVQGSGLRTQGLEFRVIRALDTKQPSPERVCGSEMFFGLKRPLFFVTLNR